LKESGARSTMTRELTTINPATEEVISAYEIMTKEQINGKAKKAQKAFSEWKKDIQKREHHIHDFAQELRKNKEELARKITQEMGKAIKEARSEVVDSTLFKNIFHGNASAGNSCLFAARNRLQGPNLVLITIHKP
jgi:acyl-CoA reductase-like NAD-dependent aldehyde dehydrogenase